MPNLYAFLKSLVTAISVCNCGQCAVETKTGERSSWICIFSLLQVMMLLPSCTAVPRFLSSTCPLLVKMLRKASWSHVLGCFGVFSTEDFELSLHADTEISEVCVLGTIFKCLCWKGQQGQMHWRICYPHTSKEELIS